MRGSGAVAINVVGIVGGTSESVPSVLAVLVTVVKFTNALCINSVGLDPVVCGTVIFKAV